MKFERPKLKALRFFSLLLFIITFAIQGIGFGQNIDSLARKLREQPSSNEEFVEMLIDMSEAYYDVGHLDSALILGDSALALTNQNNLRLKKVYLLDILQRIHVSMGSYEQAYYLLGEYEVLDDIIYNERINSQIDDLRTEIEAVRNESEITMSTARNQLTNFILKAEQDEKKNLVIIVSLLGSFAISMIFLLFQRSKLKSQLLFQEIDNLRFQIVQFVSDEGINLQASELNTRLSKPLSDRELSILQLALTNKNNKEIAKAEFISLDKVKSYLKDVYNKLGVN